MIVYPDENYDSYISLADAETYFTSRLSADEWDAANDGIKEAALQTAFRSLSELSLDIDLDEDETPLEILKNAQCEQALHELKHDLDSQNLSSVMLGSNLSVKFHKEKPSRYSERTMALVRPLIIMRTVTRTR
jgi:2-hydroxy-3-keto-5-methylthiopentenyl-1-phosphate phosphatase